MLISLAQTQPQLFILLVFSLMFALTFHEFAHAYVAYLCGDPTAKMNGRMNINPLAHLDLFGSLMILFVGFGYAKPVPVDPRHFKSRHGEFYVAAAGPGMNLLLTIAGGILFQIMAKTGLFLGGSVPVGDLLYLFMFISMNLCVFNQIPLGPLDGSYVLPRLLPVDLRIRYDRWNQQYGTYVVLGLFLVSYALPGVNPFRAITVISKSFIGFLLP